MHHEVWENVLCMIPARLVAASLQHPDPPFDFSSECDRIIESLSNQPSKDKFLALVSFDVAFDENGMMSANTILSLQDLRVTNNDIKGEYD